MVSVNGIVFVFSKILHHHVSMLKSLFAINLLKKIVKNVQRDLTFTFNELSKIVNSFV